MKKTILALATTAISTVAFAQSATNVITTSASQSTWDKIKENTSLSYYNELYGREFNNFDNSKKEALYNSISLGYKVGKGKITITPRFEVYATTKDADNGERSATMLNPRLGYAAVLYGNDNYSIFNSSRLEFGINEARNEQNRLVKIKQYNAISFNLNSKNSLDLGAEAYRWIYDGKEEDQSVALGLYLEAIHMYAFTDKISLHSAFEYDSQAQTNRTGSFYKRTKDNYSILKVGPEFFFNKNTSLYTAAFIGIDQSDANAGYKNPSLFLSLSTSI